MINARSAALCGSCDTIYDQDLFPTGCERCAFKEAISLAAIFCVRPVVALYDARMKFENMPKEKMGRAVIRRAANAMRRTR